MGRKVVIDESLFEDKHYFAEPFTKTMAWIDLLLLANHEDEYIVKRGIKILVKRGTVEYDLDSLAKRWRWSRGKVERYLTGRQTSNQTSNQKSNVTTLISIVNYEGYLENGSENGKANDKPELPSYKNNGSNVNISEKDVYLSAGHLSITWDEMNKLIDEFGSEMAETYVHKVCNYRKNSNYKSLYLTARTWIKKEVADNKKISSSTKPKLSV